MPGIMDYLLGNTNAPNFCADQELQTPSTFEPRIHKKYHAKYCFVDANDEDKGRPIHIQQPKRTPEGFHAYNEFMVGLEKINQQEFVMPGKSGANLKRPFEGKNIMLNDLTPSGVAQLAHWERCIRDRSESINKMKFSENLLRRSRMSNQTPVEHCKNGLPVRRETYELLTRMPEPDFTLSGMVITVFFAVNYWFSMYTQITTLTQVCAAPFFCPSRTSARKLPLVAPPAIFRGATVDTNRIAPPTIEAFAYPWDPTTESTKGRGFVTDWPYVQRHTGIRDFSGHVVVYDEETQIQLEKQGNEVTLLRNTEAANKNIVCNTNLGFVMDPFEQVLRTEYLDCGANKEVSFSVEAKSGSFTNSTGMDTRTSIVTFRKEAYKKRWETTQTCMIKLMNDCKRTRNSLFCVPECRGNTCNAKDWWDGIVKKRVEKDVTTKIGECVDQALNNDAHPCDCHEKAWKNNPLSYFHQGTEKIKVCDGGKGSGQICGGERICPRTSSNETVECVVKWEESEPISRNMYYGCFFAKPNDNFELSYEYKKCNFRDSDGTIYTDGGSFDGDDVQGILDVQVSKRAALVGIFLFKELGYISGFFTILAILMLLSSILLLLSPVVLIILIILKGKSPERLGLRITVVNLVLTIYTLLFTQLNIIFTLVVNLSTCYRSFVMLGAVLRASVNKSLLDMDAKLTTLSSIIYSIVLLVLVEEPSTSNSAASSTGVGTALAIQLFSLFFKLITEKVGLSNVAEPLKDLNENRLNKFETALLWVKIMEDFLQEDIQYNFVQHFNSKAPMMPDFDAPRYDVGKDFGTDDTGYLDAGHLDEIVLSYVGHDAEVRKNFYTKPLPQALANKFGHDGLGADYNPRYSSQKQAVQSVQVSNNGLIEFMPGYTEAGIIQGRAIAGPVDANAFSSLSHDDAPVLFQKPLVEGLEDEVISEIFYGSEHPHAYGHTSEKLKSPIQMLLQASGITAKSPKVNKSKPVASFGTVSGTQFGSYAAVPSLEGFVVGVEEEIPADSTLCVELVYAVK